MHNLVGRGASPTGSPTGLSFDIADLVLAKSWAGFHDFRMAIRLDHCSDHEEYEEILELRHGWRSNFKSILWRNEDAVVVQPLIGRRQTFDCLAAALDSLRTSESITLTDIEASAWPQADLDSERTQAKPSAASPPQT
jgi:hypothetical protein